MTNTNDVRVRFRFGHPRADRADGRVKIPSGASRTVVVRRPRIAWEARIGGGLDGAVRIVKPGIADRGKVRGLRIRPGHELSPPEPVVQTPLRSGSPGPQPG